MSWEVAAIALTVIGLLGSLAATMVAIFFRLGTFSGRVTTELQGIHSSQDVARTENNEAHATIYSRIQTDHEQTSEKLASVHGRLSALEERTGHVGSK